jgi:hypothetical protein
MTDWLEHTTDTCPVDPETVVEVRLRGDYVRPADKAGDMDWGSFWVASFRPPLGSPIQHPLDVTHYRIITPAKPPEPEMTKTHEEDEAYLEEARRQADREYSAYKRGFEAATKPEPDLITLRLECMKMAVSHFSILDREQAADRLLHYVLNGSVDKA